MGTDAEALKALYQVYIDSWNDKDLPALTKLFAFPMVVGGGGRDPLTIPDADAYCQRTQSIIDDIAARGWTRSVIDELHVGIMAGDTGVITVRYGRVDDGGARIEGGTSNYLTCKIDGAWKIVGMLAP